MICSIHGRTRRLAAGLAVAALVAAGGLTPPPALAVDPIAAQVAVSASEVFVGEPFQMQIQVSGSDEVEKPDVSGIKDFSVQEMGGQQNSSTSVTIINGQLQRNVSRGYIFNYALTAKEEGQLAIPSIVVRTKGQATRTQPVSIVARKPMETKEIKLRLQLSRASCYVGEPVTMTVTWYLGQDVRGFQFALPFLEDGRLQVANVPVDTGAGGPYYRVPLPTGEAIAEKGRASLDGREYAVIQFRLLLFPSQTGVIELKPATVTCEALVGYRQSRSPFDDDFFRGFMRDDFFGGRQGVYRTVVVPSNPLSLEVKDLPLAGRPAGFAGHIGEYRISASAAPTTVNVGDPITLTVSLSGPEYIERVQLPALGAQPSLARDFKIPAEIAAGKVQGGAKVFTQTIRALRPDVKAIPPIELPYFDPSAGVYRVARSEPIPLAVRASKIVTAGDAEGREPAPAASQEIEGWAKGIAHNYEDAGALQRQTFGVEGWGRSPWRLVALLVPPVLYLVVLGSVTIVRRRRADPMAVASRRAHGELSAALRRAGQATEADGPGLVLDGLRAYLGAKLRRPGAALTFDDVREPLAKSGVPAESLDELRRLFERCEAGRYAGVGAVAGGRELTDAARRVAAVVERSLR